MPAQPNKPQPAQSKAPQRSLLARFAIPVLGIAAITGAFFAAPLLNIETPPPAVAQPATQQQAINQSVAHREASLTGRGLWNRGDRLVRRVHF